MTSASHQICIIGSGVVGQATGKGFLARGFPVTFVDSNEERVRSLQQQGFIAHTVAEAKTRLNTVDVTLFTVSTPTEAGVINLSHLEAAIIDFAQRLAKSTCYHLVVIRSTVPPGTTERLIRLIEQESGKQAGRDFGVCMNPEYLREKTASHDFSHPWVIVIGEYDTRSGDLLQSLYSGHACPIYRVTIREAEMQKYVHNLFNAVKITFFNEMRQLAERLGVKSDAVFPLVAKSCEGMWNAEYGIRDKGPFDGMCLPKDTQAFLSFVRAQGLDAPLLAAAIDINNELLTQQPSLQIHSFRAEQSQPKITAAVTV